MHFSSYNLDSLLAKMTNQVNHCDLFQILFTPHVMLIMSQVGLTLYLIIEMSNGFIVTNYQVQLLELLLHPSKILLSVPVN